MYLLRDPEDAVLLRAAASAAVAVAGGHVELAVRRELHVADTAQALGRVAFQVDLVERDVAVDVERHAVQVLAAQGADQQRALPLRDLFAPVEPRAARWRRALPGEDRGQRAGRGVAEVHLRPAQVRALPGQGELVRAGPSVRFARGTVVGDREG